MRSRYSAYCTKKSDYIWRTGTDKQKSIATVEAISEFANNVQFINLSVDEIVAETTVGFTVSYIQDGVLYQFHELSTFERVSGEWRYDSGQLTEMPEKPISRSADCPCGSGKKFKRCHG